VFQVVDGVELTDFPINLIAKGQFSAVPLLIGTNLNEGTELTSGIGKKATEAEYQKWILTELGPV
jgi:carboxylesterase type B